MKPSVPLLLENATLYDGSGATPHTASILLKGGRVAAVGPQLSKPEGARVVSLERYGVSSGWIDLHTHVFADHGVFSVSPEEIGLRSGVTTLVDAGSAGALNFALFEKSVMRLAKERLLAYVNIASTGLPHGHAGVRGFVPDHLHSCQYADQLAATLLDDFADVVVGWKVRLTEVLSHHRPELEREALERLFTLREATGLPVMVHHIASALSAQELLERLGPGDVYTHLYHGRASSIFDLHTGEPLPEAWAARKRGVIFDVGHGSGAFSWEVARKACQGHGFWPDVISSDLHRYNLFWPVGDLASTMSKFLHLGMSLEEVVAAVTRRAALALGGKGGPGRLEPGDSADLTIFEVAEGDAELGDAHGRIEKVQRRIIPLAVVRQGTLTPCYGLQCGGTHTLLAQQLQHGAAL